MQDTSASTRNDGERRMIGRPAARRPDQPTAGDGVSQDGSRHVLRADANLLRLADQALRATGYLPLRELDVLEGDVDRLVILRGKVPTYHLKQVAQSAALGVSAVDRVQNELDVVTPGKPPR